MFLIFPPLDLFTDAVPPPCLKTVTFYICHSLFPQYLILKYAMSQVSHGCQTLWRWSVLRASLNEIMPFLSFLACMLSVSPTLIHRPDGFCCGDWWIRVDESTRTPCRIPNRCPFWKSSCLNVYISVCKFCVQWPLTWFLPHSSLLRFLFAQRRLV